jgi:hypothetical protein
LPDAIQSATDEPSLLRTAFMYFPVEAGRSRRGANAWQRWSPCFIDLAMAEAEEDA